MEKPQHETVFDPCLTVQSHRSLREEAKADKRQWKLLRFIRHNTPPVVMVTGLYGAHNSELLQLNVNWTQYSHWVKSLTSSPLHPAVCFLLSELIPPGAPYRDFTQCLHDIISQKRADKLVFVKGLKRTSLVPGIWITVQIFSAIHTETAEPIRAL